MLLQELLLGPCFETDQADLCLSSWPAVSLSAISTSAQFDNWSASANQLPVNMSLCYVRCTAFLVFTMSYTGPTGPHDLLLL